MSFLSLTEIRKSYYLDKEEFPVIKGVSLDFELGEFVSILGESGGGKSTLMNIIGGLDRHFSGQVKLNGRVVDHGDEKEMNQYRRDTIGYIYQSYNLVSHLSVLDNVMVPLDMTTLSPTERKQRALKLLKRVGLEEQAAKYPNQLSGGQKQRVAIARALSSDPQIIIADEPTGALDAENTADVLKILDEIAAEGKLVIAVTHSQVVADAGTRIVHLAEGKIDKDTSIRQPYTAQRQPTSLPSQKLPLSASISSALKHVKYAWKTNLLIVLGTAIGLFAVILFSGLGNGISGYINKQITDVANPWVITVARKTATSSAIPGGSNNPMASVIAASATSKPTISQSQIERVQNIKHVERVEKTYTLSNVKVSYQGNHTTVASLANWTSASSKSSIKVGHQPRAGEIVLDEAAVAKKLQSKDWKKLIGKTVQLSYVTTENQKKQTVKFSAKVAGIGKASTQQQVNGLNTSKLVSVLRANGLSTKATGLTVKVDQMAHVNNVQTKIKRIKNNGKKLFTTTSIASMISTLQTYVHLASTVLAAIAAIALIVSAMMIIVTMYMSVSARTKEIGILRALGESKRDIRMLFISESLVIGLFSAVVATALSLSVQALGNTLVATLANYAFIQISLANVGVTFALAIAISLIAAIWPARHAANLNPIDALSAD
ncbi:ABC transporter ATP-binding protein/permease [Lactiplantibacillus carotarum]|uniref:ABC transporter ATP-binding protein/permease n=1 Tax=Lactiplantibacillus carotarum TaxID=2993456 RepID=UPI00298EE56B|nr:ATP-binding cassette domain-containing protein [Lactiplantibacillus carotarum]